jgi:predicted ArsR family transcriptional regulator
MAADDDQDLFETTRGKLLVLLCRASRTVNELVDELGVTDNAVRAQLANLQEAGLVRQVGLRPGTRKPHLDYELTSKARQLFPQAHEPVLRTLVDVLRERLPDAQSESLMREVAQRLLAAWVGELRQQEPNQRAAELYQRLSGVAPGLRLDDTPDHFQVRACGCPLASVTASHPEICGLLARILSEALDTEVLEQCDRKETPQCCFSITKVSTQ